MNENGKSPEERRLGDIITTADAGAGMKAPWLTVNSMTSVNGASGHTARRGTGQRHRENVGSYCCLKSPATLLGRFQMGHVGGILTFDAPGRSWAYAIWEIPAKHCLEIMT